MALPSPANVHVSPDDVDDAVHVSSVLTLYAADGLPPLPLPPVMVADHDDVIRRDVHGVWRFHRRRIVATFHADA